MNWSKVIGALLLFGAMVLSGCGNMSKDANKPNREDATLIHEDEKVGGSMATGGGFGFDTFDLEIEVNGKDAIDAEYEVKKNAKAEFENKLTGIKLTDDKAMNEMRKLFMDILLTKDTTQQEAIDRVMKYYQIDAYSKFELEVHFDEGTILSIKDIK